MFDVLGIGGGVVGLAAAITMHQRGFKTAVIDAGDLSCPVQSRMPRIYAINHASVLMLKSLGVWQRIKQSMLNDYKNMMIWDASTGAKLSFNARDAARTSLGFMMEDDVLKQALLEEAAALGIELFSQTLVERIEEHSDNIEIFSKDQAWQTRFLIVADGALSKTRDLLGVPITTWPYHHHAIIAEVQTSKPHQATAYQVFQKEGPLAFLPLKDPYSCSIVWSTLPQHAENLMAETAESFSEQLTQAFSSKLGEVILKGARHEFPLHMRHVKAYAGQRWILMGDAAHTIHPLAGLGLNVGLADLRTWCRLLDERPHILLNHPRLLNAYQRERKYAVWQTILVMEGLKRIFMESSMPIKILRGIGVSMVNQLSFLKHYLVEYASS